MGPVSGFLAGKLGKEIGGDGIGGDILGGILGTAGSFLPWYETGGHVGRDGLAYLHKNEFVVPANAKPTKRQRAIVKRNKRKAAAKMPLRDSRLRKAGRPMVFM